MDPGNGLLSLSCLRPTAAPPQSVFRVFSGLGGSRGWLYANILWQFRGLVDRAVGGVGLRRGRQDPDALSPGDRLDFWRVEAVEANRCLRLRSEMRMPGAGWLQMEARPQESAGTVLVLTAEFDPRGLAGLVYWYSLYAVHHMMFSGLARAITRQAECSAGSATAGSRL